MESRNLFALFDRAGDAAFAVEPYGSICYWSESAEKLLGFSRAKALTKHCADIIEGYDDAGCRVCGEDCHVLEMARKQSATAAYDLHAATAWGERKWVNVTVIVADVSSGPSPLVVHLMRSIEERKKIENVTREILVRVGELTGREADNVLNHDSSGRRATELTRREAAVLGALARGRGTPEIAEDLQISAATVRNHIQRLLRKLQCHTRLEAVVRAAREGLI